MMTSGIRSRQPERIAWTKEKLVRERALALGQAIDTTTWKNYGSALNSYLNFCRLHNLPIDPTPDTLSFFTVYMCHHIKPKSVGAYLSGICQQLEPYFPKIRENRRSPLVQRTLIGCARLRAIPTTRKKALTIDDLSKVSLYYANSTMHDDYLFLSLLLTGFYALMRLGELTYPDDKTIQNPRKVTRRCSAIIRDDSYEFFLPGHKADKIFEGNRIIIRRNDLINDPYRHFVTYLKSRDHLFPASSPLWLRSDGSIPTRSFFIKRLHLFFDKSIAGQSMRAGGATSLAENGVAPTIIQAIGRWASDTFQIYIRKNPVLIQALLFGRSASAHGTALE